MKKSTNSAGSVLLNLVLAILFICVSDSYAQVNVGGQPISSLTELNTNYDIVTMPEVDSRKLLEEDAAMINIPDIPLRYGKVLDVNLNMNNSGTWETLQDGSRIWRLGIKSADAKSINLTYSDFFMPKGATFFVYNLNKSMVLGAFTDLNNTNDGQFATAINAVQNNLK